MNKTNFLAAFYCAAVVLFSPVQVSAGNWANWRGPDYNGSTTDTGAPAQFSKTENVKWAAEMPGPSAATPIIWGDKVFASSTDTKTKTLQAICLDRRTGKELWRREVGIGFNQDNRSNYASPSPVTDGKLVYFFYGTGDLVAFDLDGKKVWDRNIQKDYGQFAFLWTFSSSPLIHDGRLYMQVLQRNEPVQGRGRSDGPNESYLLALDPKTGKELWKHVRPSDAIQESLEAFTTPIPFSYKGREELLIAGGDCITGHDPETGKELWRWGTYNPTLNPTWRLVPSPVTGDGVVLVCAPKKDPIYAVKAGLSGNLKDSDLAWKSQNREISTDVCTPLFYKGRFYVLNGERQTLSRVEPKTGKVEWIGELGSRVKIESSPTAADDKIYFMDHRGEVFVVAAGPEYKLLHQTSMRDEGDSDLRASIAIAGGNLFIRTGSKLYCAGN